MSFDATERSFLAQLADELIPPADGLLSASQANVANDGLDQVLAVRPDLAAPLKKILQTNHGKAAPEVIAHLRRNNPAAFGVLTELVAGAYFLNPAVRDKLAYSGQIPQPIDPRPDYLDDGLLDSVIKRGPVYRPTPDGKSVG